VTGACSSSCGCRPKFQVSPRKLGVRTGVNAISPHEQHGVFGKAEGKPVLTFFPGWQKPHHIFVKSKPVDTHEREDLFYVETSSFSLITIWMLMAHSSPDHILRHHAVVGVCRVIARSWSLIRKHAFNNVLHFANVLLVVRIKGRGFWCHSLTWLSFRGVV
jgi:hypothetical protein